MNTIAVVAFLLAASSVLAQNPYEYVDDDLIQKVGQIVFQYDQQVAASRSAGGVGQSYNNFNNVNNGGYKPEPVARQVNYGRSVVSNNVQYQQPQRQQRQYNFNQVQQQQRQTYVQQPQRQVYQPVVQAPVPVARTYQQQVPVVQQQVQRVNYQAPVARTYQTPVQQYSYQAPRNNYQAAAPVVRKYEEPQQVQTKSVVTGYSLSQPEPVARVAEFHFVEGQESRQGQSQDNYQYGQVRRGVSSENVQVQHRGDFRLA